MQDTCLLDHEQLLELVESVWTAMVGLPIAPSEPSEPVAADENTKVLTACVQITGAWRGTVLFEPSWEAANRASSIMLGIPEAELRSSDVHDTVAELCNIIGGGIKSLLPGPSSLSLPMVLHGSQYGIRIPFTQSAAQMEFVSEGQPLKVRVLEELEHETARRHGS